MRALALCSSCKRHVKANEARCPFCSAAVVLEQRQTTRSPRGLPGGRAALFLTGAALAAPGCADEPEPDDGNDLIGVPVYGVAIDSGLAPRPDAGAPLDAGRDTGLIAQPYGIPVPVDASIQTPRDAGPRCPQVGNLPAPVYGVGIDVPPRDLCSDAGVESGKDAGKDAGNDAGKDAGQMPVPPYGVSIDGGIVAPAYGIAIDPNR